MIRDGSVTDLLSLLRAFPLFERRPLAISSLFWWTRAYRKFVNALYFFREAFLAA